ncbi:MAG: HAMP domain-containing sensor histidine kinase, partial [Pseudomonadota bacterium]
MRIFHTTKIRTKFLVPILLLQFIALGVLGLLGYRFSSSVLRAQAEHDFRMTIDGVYSSVENELADRMAKIGQLTSNSIFTKFTAAAQYKSDAEVEVFNFQKGNGLILGEPEVGGLVNFPVGLLANEGNRKILETGLFPSMEYVGADGFVKLHIYFGGSNDEDFKSADRSKLSRLDKEWFEAANRGEPSVEKPSKTTLYLRSYQPITFNIEEVPVEKELITIALPHRVGDIIKGVFMITTTPDFIANATSGIKTSSLLLILDQKGDVIASPGESSIMPDISRDFLERAAETPPGKIIDIDNRLLMHKPIPAAGWSILMIGDKDLIYGSVYRLRDNIFLIMLASLAVMAAIVFVVIRKSLAPVINLTKASDRIASGELGVVIEKDSDDEIGRLTESFNHMSLTTKDMHEQLDRQNVRLSKMNFVRRQLLNIISHELRTPLSQVVSFYDLLQCDMQGEGSAADAKEFSKLFENLGMSIERFKLLVERLTKASSIMSVQIRSEEEFKERATLDEILPATCEEAKRGTSGRNVDVTYPRDLAIDLACPADAVKLILEEALSNAIKYSPDNGTVSVDISAKNGNASILVRDRGQGISKEYIEDVVEPFFEIQDTNYHTTGRFGKEAGGLGLGLTIIMSVLRQYRGTLAIENPDDGGTLL